MFRLEYKKCIHSFGEGKPKKSWPLGTIEENQKLILTCSYGNGL